MKINRNLTYIDAFTLYAYAKFSVEIFDRFCINIYATNFSRFTKQSVKLSHLSTIKYYLQFIILMTKCLFFFSISPTYVRTLILR